MFNPSPTFKAAEAYALNMGVHAHFSSPKHLPIANIVNQGLAEAKMRELPLPKTVVFHSAPNQQARLAWIDARQSKITINTAATTWMHLNYFVPKNFTNGFWSTGDPLHPILHELGHLRHYQENPISYLRPPRSWTDKDKSVANTVSVIASMDHKEFVAEVHVGLLVDSCYNKDVKKLYKEFTGRKFP